jgi:dienelactone hydrolase
MSSPPYLTLLVCILTLAAMTGPSSPAAAQSYYEEDVSASDPLRAEQAHEMDGYVQRMKADSSRLDSLFRPDFGSPSAYQASTVRLRRRFAEIIGYPPPGNRAAEAPSFTRIGADGIGIYYRARIPVVEGLHAEGILIVPKGLHGRAPLLIAMHGGGGSPEVALFHGGANYHDMVRGGIKMGYVVFAPQHLFAAQGYPADIRTRMDDRLRLVGTTLTAVEIAKITRSIDVLAKRPEVDSKRIGMVGLSYGGYYTLMTTAIDTRIRAAVSSCYFGVQESRYAHDELSVPYDFRFVDRFSLFRDPILVALICPRSLEIQAGAHDEMIPAENGRRMAEEAAGPYRRLGIAESFRFVLFPGSHEFNDASAWEFLRTHL